jgi:hypothetical protein
LLKADAVILLGMLGKGREKGSASKKGEGDYFFHKGD